MSVPAMSNPNSTPDTAATGSAVMEPSAGITSTTPPPSAAPSDLVPGTTRPPTTPDTNGPVLESHLNPDDLGLRSQNLGKLAPTVVPEVAAAPAVKYHAGMMENIRGLLHNVADALGGPKTEAQFDENTGERLPDKTISGGRRALSFLGKEMTGISAGMGAARGPGGFGKAMAASAEAVLNLTEKQKAQNMQTVHDHMIQFAAYRNMSASATKLQEENAERDVPRWTKLLQSGKFISLGDPDAPLTGRELHDKEKQLKSQGYNHSQLMWFAGKPILHDPEHPENGSEQGHILLIPTASPDKSQGISSEPITLQPGDEGLAGGLGKPGARPTVGATVPAGLLNNGSTVDIVWNGAIDSVNRELDKSGVKVEKPFTLNSITDPSEYQRGWAAVKDWQRFHVTGDPAKDLEEMRKVNESGANFINQNLYGGKADDVSENLRLAEEKRDQINKDPEKALATPEYRGLMAKNISIMKYLDAQQKKVYMDEINQIPNMTVAQAITFVNMVTGEDFKAMQAKSAADAKAQQASDARADRELQLKLKEGEDATPEEIQATVDAIGQARQQMTPALARTPQGRAMMGQVNEQYKNFDATLFPTYEKMRESFISGRDGRTLEAISKVTQHMRLMHDTVTSGSTGWAGKAMGSVQGIMGIDTDAGRRAQSLQPMVTGISTELDKAYSQGATTISGIDAWLKTVDTQYFGQNPTQGRCGSVIQGLGLGDEGFARS